MTTQTSTLANRVGRLLPFSLLLAAPVVLFLGVSSICSAGDCQPGP